MNGRETAYIGADIHDGTTLWTDHALVFGKTPTVRTIASLPEGMPTTSLDGGLITPRFVDLQVNGGGGVMFNDSQTVGALQTIADAHRVTGTGAILPTLITDTPTHTAAAIAAVEQAIADGVAGIAGLHLEGPHLAQARKGAHDGALIRKMEGSDLDVLLKAADRIANLMVTVAPETTSNAQITAMAQAGIVVSLGHTDAPANVCHAAFDAGANCVTHLFNAMSQMTGRAPGLVGAVLARDDVFAGLIADGIHVDPAMIRIALAAKSTSEKIFLVTDAMATAGSDITSFMLNGRCIRRQDHRLTLDDGTLAGADLTMPKAITVMGAGCDAIARATSTPALLLRDPAGAGTLSKGAIYFAKGIAGSAPPVGLK